MAGPGLQKRPQADLTTSDAEAEDAAGMPRWVKIFLAVGVLLALAFFALHLAGNGFRGHGA